MCKCKWPEGVDVRPDGVHSLDPCQYILTEIHRNVDVYVNVCKKCGHVDIAWRRTPETISTIEDEALSAQISNPNNITFMAEGE